jgi:hypothetical protein
MVAGRHFSVVLVVAACAGLCGGARAQDAAGKPIKPFELHTPFPIDAQTPRTELVVSYRQPDAMTEQDKLLEADSESAINEKAGFTDLGFNVGKWGYTQIACPALPNHLFLGFMRNDGVGDVSLFSALIPRNGEGRVRIIPIRRRGYSYFSPAPINALTISAFNHILTEERAAQVPDWAGMATCYAALAGARPAVSVAEKDQAKYPEGAQVILSVPAKGGAEIQFIDVAVPQKPMRWTLTFNAKGRLLKAKHVPAELVVAKADPTRQIETRTVPPSPW